ncbi:hypothetical protein SAMN06269250_5018 [Spirosoma fluviale]|uniref:Uncharacterized protein n=2 Tax=Spirosoma fluviale TaxID=1597977 RepID=A0A286GK34_9BACT|nr:hypothetical protein SAMN06269250_5018 [Spirosoma fluviale]
MLSMLFNNLHHIRAQNDVILANQQILLSKSESTDLKALRDHQRNIIFEKAKEHSEMELDLIENNTLGEDLSDSEIPLS